MANSVSTGRILIFSSILAIIGYFIVYFVGLGVSDNGALSMAIGLFVGASITPHMIAYSMKGMSGSAAPKVHTSSANDSEIISIFVGNLAFKVRGRQLAELFEPFGAIESIRIVKDRNTGRGKGFGFVDMKASAARRAISELDGSEFFGRTLKVSEANAQKND